MMKGRGTRKVQRGPGCFFHRLQTSQGMGQCSGVSKDRCDWTEGERVRVSLVERTALAQAWRLLREAQEGLWPGTGLESWRRGKHWGAAVTAVTTSGLCRFQAPCNVLYTHLLI